MYGQMIRGFASCSPPLFCPIRFLPSRFKPSQHHQARPSLVRVLDEINAQEHCLVILCQRILEPILRMRCPRQRQAMLRCRYRDIGLHSTESSCGCATGIVPRNSAATNSGSGLNFASKPPGPTISATTRATMTFPMKTRAAPPNSTG
jgi:hypothetical protein